MFIVDSHCDSIQLVDHCKYGIVNPHNYSTKHQQIQFVAMMTGWPGDTVEAAWRRACRYTGLFCMSMASEQIIVAQLFIRKRLFRLSMSMQRSVSTLFIW